MASRAKKTPYLKNEKISYLKKKEMLQNLHLLKNREAIVVAEEKEPVGDDDWGTHVTNRRVEMATLRKYFESLKVRDLIIGRIALLVLLTVSILTIAAPDFAKNLNVTIAFVTTFSTVALYWVGKNGYFFSVAALFSMVIDKNFSSLEKRDIITHEAMKCVEEQRLLLANYSADCPDLTLLHVLNENRVKKDAYAEYRRLANGSRFREKLKVNCFVFILTHFFACERIADEKIRVIRVIEDTMANETKMKK